MKCCVDGCDRDAMYKSAKLCQKHYFRRMRYGTTELTKKAKYRYTSSSGYQRILEPQHALADSTGYVYEHRMVMYASMGPEPKKCEICGDEWRWEWANSSHVDHINEDKSDNRPENLRPLCNSCNVSRSRPVPHLSSSNHAITFDGRTMTPAEWAREPDVLVCGNSIIRRLSAGMSVEDALFAEKKTHNGKITVDKRVRKTESKSDRSNAVAITIDGVTMTAAEWSRHPMCTVSCGTIVNRARAGVEPNIAVFSPPRSRSRVASRDV